MFNLKTSARLIGGATVALAMTTVQAQQTFTLRATTFALNDANHGYFLAFKEGVESRSKGRVKIDVFPAGQLGPTPRTIEGVTLGTVDFDMPATGFLIGVDPRFVVFDAPGLFDSMEHAQVVLRDPAIRTRIASMGAERNLEALFPFAPSPLALLSHKPVRAVTDLKGLRVRAPGGAPMHIEPFKALGAFPLSMPLNEVLPAMQNRGIDGTMSGWQIYAAFKYWDVAKAVTEVPGMFLASAVVASRSKLKALGPELEALVRAEALRAESYWYKNSPMDLARVRALWQANGGERIVFDPAEQKKFIAQATAMMPQLVAGNPKVQEDYEAFLAAAKKYRGK